MLRLPESFMYKWFVKEKYDITEVEKNSKARIVSTSITDVLEEYLATHQHLDREIDGRLTLIR